jgi:hypothetical protein
MDSGRSEDGHDEEFVNMKIELEERKLLVAQRKLESIRLLDELLERVKVNIYFPGPTKVGRYVSSVLIPSGLPKNWMFFRNTEKNNPLNSSAACYPGQNDVSTKISARLSFSLKFPIFAQEPF